MNNEDIKSNLLNSRHWLRLLFMVIFAVFLQIARVVMWVVVIVQFLFALITGQDNVNLRQFGLALSTFIFQTLKFLTYNSEEKPFPFSDWPEPEEPHVETEVLVPVETKSKPRVRVAKPKATPPNDGPELP